MQLDCGQTARITEVNREVETLEKSIIRATDNLTILRGRLTPVLMNKPVSPTGADKESPMCPLAQKIRELRAGVDNISGNIANILSDLEL